MKLIKNIFIFIGLGTSVLMYPFSYDSAIYAAQKGNWQDAHAALNNIIINNPDNADVLYDAGVATYNLGNSGQAATCFTRAAECSSDKSIAVRAHFNAGNAYVDEKNLKGALEQYNKALAIEPDNEYVRHNRDRVEQMLQNEEKNQENKQNKQKDDQQQKDQQDDRNNDDKQENKEDKHNNDQKNNQQDNDQQDKSQGNEQQNQDGKNEEQNNKNDQSDGDNGSQQKNDKQQQQQNQQSDDLDEQSQADQRDNATERSKETERKEHGNKEQQQKDSSDNQKRNGKDEFNKQAHDAKDKGDKQQGDQHNKAPEKENKINDKNNVPDHGAQEQVIDDPWLLTVLNNQEMRDKAMNKQLMEAKIRQHGGKNGQNCW